jgi:hypothetical protein
MTAITVAVSVRVIAGEIDDYEDVVMMLGKNVSSRSNIRLQLGTLTLSS